MDTITFETAGEFRDWLEQHHDGKGVWLLFGKAGGPKTVSAAEALELALCYGWIDGQMKKLDELSYAKYFAPRRTGSNWSEKNKKSVEELLAQGKITEYGLAVIERSKADGSYDKPKAETQDSPEHIAELAERLAGHEPAASNFAGKSHSVQKTYSRMYFDAKSEEARGRRLEKIIQRLDQNLNPM